MSVPCGKCAFCLKRRIDHWCTRLREELSVSSSAFFLTLTYSDDFLVYDIHTRTAVLEKSHIQRWLKRLRKKNGGIRYYAIGEYGSQGERPHYHVLLFNLIDLDLVTATWYQGYVKGSRMTGGRIRYCVAYCLGVTSCSQPVKPFSLMSRNPGIGASYVERMGKYHRARSDSVVYDFDIANSMPRYYLDKIFTSAHQREFIRYKKMLYSQSDISPPPTQAEHDRLFKKLNRKNL